MSRSASESCFGFFTSFASRIAPGTGAENGPLLCSELANRLVEAFFLQELQLCGALAARQDQPVTTLQRFRRADLDALDAQFLSIAACAAKSPCTARIPIFT